MYDEYLENEDNIKIVESLKKGCYSINQDDWEQFRRIIIWKAAKGYDPNHTKGAKFTSYLYTKAKFEIMKHNTKVCKEQPLYVAELDYIANGKPAPEEGNLEDLLDSLGPQYNEIISLRYVYNYSIREICKQLGIRQDECRQRIEEGVGALRETVYDVGL